MTNIATIAVSIIAQTDGLEKGLKGVSKSISKFRNSVLGAVGLGGLGELVKESFEAGERMENLAKRTGASTEFLSEMEAGAKRAGSSLEAIVGGIGRMQRAIIQASGGNKKLAADFAELGINLAEFQKLNPDQQFTTLAEALDRIKDPAEKTKLAMDLLGKGGAALIPVFDGGAKKINAMREEARAFGQSIGKEQAEAAEKGIRAIDDISLAFSGLARQMSLQLAPGLTKIIEGFGTILPDALRVTLGVFTSIGQALGGYSAFFEQLTSGNLRGAVSVLDSLAQDIPANFRSPSAAPINVAANVGSPIKQDQTAQAQVDEQKRTNDILQGIKDNTDNIDDSGATFQ